MLLACPLLVELGPAWGSMGLCWEDPCPPAAMPLVAERGGTEAFPGGWLDIVLDTMDDRLYLVDVLAEDIPKKINLIIQWTTSNRRSIEYRLLDTLNG